MYLLRTFSFLIIPLLLIGAGCTWFKKDTSSSTPNTQVPMATSTPPSAPVTTGTPLTVSASGQISIPNVKTKLTVPESLRDIRYTIRKNEPEAGGATVYVTTERLAASSPDCSLDNSPLGMLVKAKTLPPGMAENTEPNVIYQKIGDYYLYYIGPQATCSADPAVITLQQNLMKDLQSVLKELKTAP